MKPMVKMMVMNMKCGNRRRHPTYGWQPAIDSLCESAPTDRRAQHLNTKRDAKQCHGEDNDAGGDDADGDDECEEEQWYVRATIMHAKGGTDKDTMPMTSITAKSGNGKGDDANDDHGCEGWQ